MLVYPSIIYMCILCNDRSLFMIEDAFGFVFFILFFLGFVRFEGFGGLGSLPAGILRAVYQNGFGVNI